ncbi:hypothetical protein TNCV_4175421 [Trichonephila clavipes]|nr:hypothetical protein TNCV_4175421 [Trichonephila clavipes]
MESLLPKKTFVSKKNFCKWVLWTRLYASMKVHMQELKILKALKINPGVNTCEGLRKIDYVRICEAEMAVQKLPKKPGQQKGKLKGKQDALEQINAKMSTVLEIVRL